MSATSIDGLLLVDKPAGPTSHDVVAITRRAAAADRAGHTGTLDPFATGLLVVLLGRATRLVPYVPGEPKVYEAVIAFGSETDTDDATGTTTATAPAPPESAIGSAVTRLTGELEQTPPAYSAKQVEGRRAHAAARGGAPLRLAAASVTVHAWELTDYTNGVLRATVTCGGGTYIRALARDLGRLTGSAAHLAALRRCASGPFVVSEAVPLERVRAGDFSVAPPLAALPDMARATLDAGDVRAIRNGRPVPAEGSEGRAALVDTHGELVAIAEREREQWRPRVVLPA